MKRIVFVSDIHAGSFYGLLPPDFLTFEGVPKLQNVGQKYLWECWLDLANRVEAFNPNCVIINGDCVDGLQRKNHGSELSLTNWKDQRDAAIKTLKVLRSVTRKAKWYFTQGTPYHVGNFGEAEEDVAEAMGATAYPSVGTGKYCREVLTLEVEPGFTLQAAHHIGFASVYPTTPMAKEMSASKAAGRDVQLQVRSHVHNHTEVFKSGCRIVTTPCWQLQTRYARKNSVDRLIPDLGALFIEVEKGQSRTWVEAYESPKVEIAKL